MKELQTNENLVEAIKAAKLSNSTDPLLELDNIEDLVPQIPPYDLYAIISKTGINDSVELIEMCTSKQIQLFFDFDCWNKDQIRLARYLDWLQILLDTGFEKLGKFIDEIEPNMTGFFLANSAIIFNLKEGEPPQFNDAVYYQTPDGFYELRPQPQINEDIWKGVMALVDNLYRYNIELAHHILTSCMWDTTFNLQEEAYQSSKKRLETLGFWDYYEALSIYRMTDPAQIKLDEHTKDYIEYDKKSILPVLPESFKKEGPFGTGYQSLSQSKQKEVNKSVLHLINKMAAADRITPDDEMGFSRIIKLAWGSINLGIAYVSRNREPEFSKALNNISISRLFSAGYSLGLQLKTLGLTLSRSAHISISPRTSTLLEGKWLAFYSSLTKGHPSFHLGFLNKEGESWFGSLEQIAYAGSVIEDMSKFKLLGFNYLKIPADILTQKGLSRLSRQNPGEITFGDLLRTWALIQHFDLDNFKGLTEENINSFETERIDIEPEEFYKKMTQLVSSKLDDKITIVNLRRLLESHLELLFSHNPVAPLVIYKSK